MVASSVVLGNVLWIQGGTVPGTASLCKSYVLMLLLASRARTCWLAFSGWNRVRSEERRVGKECAGRKVTRAMKWSILTSRGLVII